MIKDTMLATINNKNNRDKILDNCIKELVIMERDVDLVSTEYLKDIKDYIINIVDNIIEWIKINWNKIVINLEYFISYFDNSVIDVNTILNKGDIKLSKNSIEYYNNTFSVLFKDYKDVVYFPNVINDIINSVVGVIKTYKENGELLFPTYNVGILYNLLKEHNFP